MTKAGDPASVAGHDDPRYAGFFRCFNAGRYYEAHDVLEGLWLVTRGEPRPFYKALIQVAGAFVHLEKGHFSPAARLLRRAQTHFQPYAPRTAGLDVTALLLRMDAWLAQLEAPPERRHNPARAIPRPRLETGSQRV